jgi:hypothetical protein
MLDLKEISHGHVVKRDDGMQARCMGLPHCTHCQLEAEVVRLREEKDILKVRLSVIPDKVRLVSGLEAEVGRLLQRVMLLEHNIGNREIVARLRQEAAEAEQVQGTTNEP